MNGTTPYQQLMNPRFGRMACLCIFLACPASILATTLPPATYGGHFSNSNYPSFSTPGTYTDGVVSTISLSAYPALTENITSHQPGISGQNGAPSGWSAYVQTTYYFEVTGGNPGDRVPILIQYYFKLAGSSAGVNVGSVADAGLSVCADGCESSSGIDAIVAKQVSSSNSLTSQIFTGPLSVTVSAGRAHTITLSTDTSVTAGDYHNPGFADASAFADPYIYVDPSFANAANYSIIVSPGIVNAPLATPEPATLGLMGFILVAGSLLMRRKSVF